MGLEMVEKACLEQDEGKIKVLLSVLDKLETADQSVKDLHFWIEKVCDPSNNFCEELNRSLPQVRLFITSHIIYLMN